MFPENVCVWNDQKRTYAKIFVCKSIIQKKENLLHGNTKCTYTAIKVLIRSYSRPSFSEFGLNTERYGVSPNAGIYGPE